jgi:hypothetical protein
MSGMVCDRVRRPDLWLLARMLAMRRPTGDDFHLSGRASRVPRMGEHGQPDSPPPPDDGRRRRSRCRAAHATRVPSRCVSNRSSPRRVLPWPMPSLAGGWQRSSARSETSRLRSESPHLRQVRNLQYQHT